MLLALISHGSVASNAKQVLLADQSDHVRLADRELWMSVAKQALSPCAHEAFGAAIVNHTSTDGPGSLVCTGANTIFATGNPTLHGEIAAINNCTAVLRDPSGPYRLSPVEVMAAYKDLTLYMTAEPCPMCATAIRWAGFKECVFGTNTGTLKSLGWSQVNITSQEVFDRSGEITLSTRLIGGVLEDRTDPLFQWQYDHHKECPSGCERKHAREDCSPIENQ